MDVITSFFKTVTFINELIDIVTKINEKVSNTI